MPHTLDKDIQDRARRVFDHLSPKVAMGIADPFFMDVYRVCQAVVSQATVEHAQDVIDALKRRSQSREKETPVAPS